MHNKRGIGGLGLIGAFLVLVIQVAPVSAAPVRFGALLTSETQPSNAEGGQSCRQNAPAVPSGGVCSWVSTSAYQNGSRFKAPKAGTINKLSLVSCVGGSFVLQFARVNAQQRAKLVRSGPRIRYVADLRQTDGDDNTFCGGDNGDDYIIQEFNISVHVNQGDYIVAKAKRLGTLHCSGGNSPMLFYPALATGQAYRTRTDNASCDLLVQLQYA